MKIIDFIKTGGISGIRCGMNFDEAKSVIGHPIAVSIRKPPEIYTYGNLQLYVSKNIIFGISIVINEFRRKESTLDMEDYDDFSGLSLENFVKMAKNSSMEFKMENEYNQILFNNDVTGQFQDDILIALTLRDWSFL